MNCKKIRLYQKESDIYHITKVNWLTPNVNLSIQNYDIPTLRG